mgnify:CR=1 FL=1
MSSNMKANDEPITRPLTAINTFKKNEKRKIAQEIVESLQKVKPI